MMLEFLLIALQVLIVFLQFVFTLSLIIAVIYLLSHKVEWKKGEGGEPATVSIVIPVYKEREESVMVTVNSILAQDYPRDKMEVILVGERDEQESLPMLEKVSRLIEKHGIRSRVVANERKRCGKGAALNEALKYVKGEVFVAFDADDRIPPSYLMDGVSLLKEGYAALTAKVYREGDNPTAKLLHMDTVFYYTIGLPAIYLVAGGYSAISGEGLMIKTEVLREVGGFPDVLTEDAAMAIKLSEKGYKMALLGDVVVEKAPERLVNHLKQRKRWFGGYFECFKMLLKSKVPLKHFFGLLFLYLSPLNLVSHTVTMSSFVAYWIAWMIGYTPITNFIIMVYSGFLFYWGLFIFFIGNYFLTMLMVYSISDTEYEWLMPYTMLFLFYWYILGLVVVYSIFAPKVWHKTERWS